MKIASWRCRCCLSVGKVVVLSKKIETMKRIIPFLMLALSGFFQAEGQTVVKLKESNAGMFTHAANNPKYSWQDGQLVVVSGGKTDFFNSPDGAEPVASAPLLLKELDNSRPFTFTVAVEPSFTQTYDAGAVYLFHDRMLWQKMAYEMDERGNKRIVTVRTVNTSDDNNHDVVLRERVYMKISSDTKNVGFYYSLDGKEWQLVRLYRNEYPAKIYIGISSQSPLGNGISARFSHFDFSESAIENFRMGL